VTAVRWRGCRDRVSTAGHGLDHLVQFIKGGFLVFPVSILTGCPYALPQPTPTDHGPSVLVAPASQITGVTGVRYCPKT